MCNRDEVRRQARDEAVDFIRRLYSSDIPHIALENPAGQLTAAWRPCTQIVYPWIFGDPYRQEIQLWLKNLPPLISTCINPQRKSISNHVNGSMAQSEISVVRSSWKYYPMMVQAICHQWFPRIAPASLPLSLRSRRTYGHALDNSTMTNEF